MTSRVCWRQTGQSIKKRHLFGLDKYMCAFGKVQWRVWGCKLQRNEAGWYLIDFCPGMWCDEWTLHEVCDWGDLRPVYGYSHFTEQWVFSGKNRLKNPNKVWRTCVWNETNTTADQIVISSCIDLISNWINFIIFQNSVLRINDSSKLLIKKCKT